MKVSEWDPYGLKNIRNEQTSNKPLSVSMQGSSATSWPMPSFTHTAWLMLFLMSAFLPSGIDFSTASTLPILKLYSCKGFLGMLDEVLPGQGMSGKRGAIVKELIGRVVGQYPWKNGSWMIWKKNGSPQSKQFQLAYQRILWNIFIT